MDVTALQGNDTSAPRRLPSRPRKDRDEKAASHETANTLPSIDTTQSMTPM